MTNAHESYERERNEKKGRNGALPGITPFTNIHELTSYEKVHNLMIVSLFSVQRKYIETRYHLLQARYNTRKSLLTILSVWQIDIHHVPVKQV